MTEFDWIMVFFSSVSIIGIPILVMLIRGAMKWTKVEIRLDTLIRDVAILIQDKDKVHGEILTTMREDRLATDQRLRWLEVNIWNQQRRRPQRDGN